MCIWVASNCMIPPGMICFGLHTSYGVGAVLACAEEGAVPGTRSAASGVASASSTASK